MWYIRVSLIAFLLLFVSAHVYARDRIALVVGNADYRVKPLANPANDARDIAQALNKVDFDVTLLINANQEQMESAIQSFGEKLHRNSVALFFYSGHGVQYEGSNYLIPTNTMSHVSTPSHLRYKAVDAGYVLGVMEQSGSELNIVLLDACRDNPFKSFSRSMNRGLARIAGAEGSLIAYSTAPGKVSLDGNGRNSPYTKQLITFLEIPNIPIELMLKKVRTEVKKETDGKQSPWYEASIDGDFYFSNGTEGKPRKLTDVEMSAVDFIGLYYNTIKKAPYSRTWAMLADSFREKTGFSSYIGWWDKKVDEVWIEKVKQLSPNKVQATLLYRMKTGKTICSIDTFTLRQDSGAWLIYDQVYKNCAQ